MIFVYKVLTYLIYPVLFILIHYRKIVKKEDPIRFKEKIFPSHFKVEDKKNLKLIWFHAASIGEFKSIIPIINQLNLSKKNLLFLITTSTFSSGNLAEIELKKIENAMHRYFPFDVAFIVDKFLLSWKPDKIFLVDSEIWPNLILKAKKYNIPIALINARLTAKSFKKWMIFPNISKKIFNIFSLFLCSNNQTKRYLEKLELKNIYFKGNIKLTDVVDEKKIINFNENVLQKKRFWFAASTHEEEDFFCLKTHLELKETYKDFITIIAPRHIERSKKIKLLSEKLNLNSQIINKNENILENKEIIIINYFGALKNYFKFTKSVFIGKSIIKRLKYDGGQNPIEAAKLGCKIYHGPYVCNFEDIYKILEQNNISKKVESHEELSKNLIEDLKNPQKNKNDNNNIMNKLGQKTLKETMEIVEAFLNNEII